MDTAEEDYVSKQRLPTLMEDLVNGAGDFLASYGWYILGVLAVIALCWSSIQNYLDRLYERRLQQFYDAQYHKDPDQLRSRWEGMQKAREKMQRELYIKSEQYVAKMKEKEAQKLADKVNKYSYLDVGNRLGSDNKPQSRRNDEYSPLIGDNNSGRYIPPRRNVCPSSGCG